MLVTAFEIISILLVLTAAFGWINHRFIKLPHTIGLLVMGLGASLVLVGTNYALPGALLFNDLEGIVRQIDFQATVLNGMLAFLLFAGAMHVNLSVLWLRAWPVISMATIGTIISTFVVGVGFWIIARALQVPIPFAWTLVFGALISPTDPVAVLSTLKLVRVPQTLEIDMAGESLFNDGVGVVIFTVLLAAAVGADGAGLDALHIGRLVFVEALGGAALGLAMGYIAYRAMRAIDDYPVEVLISLALVTGTYTLAAKLHFSGPIAVVVAGLLIGTHAPRDALSDETQRHLFGFWALIDEILNSVLFLLIGLEVLVLRLDLSFAWLASAVCAADPGGAPVGCLDSCTGLERDTHLYSRDNSRSDLGRAAGRHLDCPSTFAARSGGEVGDPGLHLCHRSVHNHSSRPEPARLGRARGPLVWPAKLPREQALVLKEILLGFHNGAFSLHAYLVRFARQVPFTIGCVTCFVGIKRYQFG